MYVYVHVYVYVHICLCDSVIADAYQLCRTFCSHPIPCECMDSVFIKNQFSVWVHGQCVYRKKCFQKVVVMWYTCIYTYTYIYTYKYIYIYTYAENEVRAMRGKYNKKMCTQPQSSRIIITENMFSVLQRTCVSKQIDSIICLFWKRAL